VIRNQTGNHSSRPFEGLIIFDAITAYYMTAQWKRMCSVG